MSQVATVYRRGQGKCTKY